MTDDQMEFSFLDGGAIGPNVRETDPFTSHLAANERPQKRIIDRRRVLQIHYMNPDGLTDYELAAIMKRQQNSVGKRRGELRDQGFIECTWKTKEAPSGSPCLVWRITAKGKEKIEKLKT